VSLHVAVVSAVWGRPHVTRLWWRAAERLRYRWAAAGIDVHFVIGGNETVHLRMTKDNAAEWVSVENSPLGNKFNTVMQRAALRKPDYFFIMGSDDFLSDRALDLYISYLFQGYAHIGMRGSYFYDVASREAASFRCYPLGHTAFGWPIGSGRVIHSSIMEPFGFRPWSDHRYRGMDADFMQRVQPPQAKMIDLSEEVIALDVKTATNIWSYAELVKVFQKVEPVTDINKTFKVLAEWPAISELRIEMEPKFAARNPIEKGVRRRAPIQGQIEQDGRTKRPEAEDRGLQAEAGGGNLLAESREGQAERVANG
jgi:hypothetical protein